MVKSVKFLLLPMLIISPLLEQLVDSGGITRFRDAKCSSSNKTMSVKCFVKAHNRNTSYLNVLANFHTPAYTAWVWNLIYFGSFLINCCHKLNFSLALRSVTTNYRTLITLSGDVCKFLNGTKNNKPAEWLLNILFQERASELFHPCPFTVRRINLFWCRLHIQILSPNFSGTTRISKHLPRHELGSVALSWWSLQIYYQVVQRARQRHGHVCGTLWNFRNQGQSILIVVAWTSVLFWWRQFRTKIKVWE